MSNFDEQQYINQLNQTSLPKFKIQMRAFNKFVIDPLWKKTLSFDMAMNQDFSNDVYKYINLLSKNKKNIDFVNEIMLEIYQKSKVLIDEAFECDNPICAWLTARKAYAYYGLNEIINEGSKFSEFVLKELKREYGKDYLQDLKKMDNSNPSNLTNIKQTRFCLVETFASQLYLLMKSWQDKQHEFHNNDLHPKFSEFREKFKKYVGEKSNVFYSVGLYVLNNTPILPINVVTRFVLAGMASKLNEIVGGKNVGLAILNGAGANIPKTFCISVKSLENKLFEKHLQDIDINCFSVRSSATLEDGGKNSFAGMFKSCLNVKRDDLIDAINEVYDSLTTKRVREYVKFFKTGEPHMSIVLQEFSEPEISGVWLGNGSMSGHLEWTHGNGEKLVSGKVAPHYEQWSIGGAPNTPCLELKKPIGLICIEMQNQLGEIADFEWCILNGEFVWLQFRPVTVKFDVETSNDTSAKIKGCSASSGVAKGLALYYEDPVDCENFEKGSILLADFTDPDWLPIMLKSSAIITAEGGFLSHAAIISRELGIPCITGLGYDNIALLNKKMIKVDGSKGTIQILDENHQT